MGGEKRRVRKLSHVARVKVVAPKEWTRRSGDWSVYGFCKGKEEDVAAAASKRLVTSKAKKEYVTIMSHEWADEENGGFSETEFSEYEPETDESDSGCGSQSGEEDVIKEEDEDCETDCEVI